MFSEFTPLPKAASMYPLGLFSPRTSSPTSSILYPSGSFNRYSLTHHLVLRYYCIMTPYQKKCFSKGDFLRYLDSWVAPSCHLSLAGTLVMGGEVFGAPFLPRRPSAASLLQHSSLSCGIVSWQAAGLGRLGDRPPLP